MIKLVRFRSVTRIDRESPYRLEATWNHLVSIGLNASQSARNASRLSYSPEASNSSAPPLFLCRPWYFDIESPVLIVAHYSQPLKPMLYLNQPFKHIATNNNLPLTAFSQRLQMRGIQTDLLRQIGKEFSVYDFLSFISVYPLNFNKPGRIKSVHLVFIFKTYPIWLQAIHYFQVSAVLLELHVQITHVLYLHLTVLLSLIVQSVSL